MWAGPAVAEMVAMVERARELREWPDMADRLRMLAERLPARLELLARSVLDLLDDDEFELAAHVWAHLHEVARQPKLRPTLTD